MRTFMTSVFLTSLCSLPAAAATVTVTIDPTEMTFAEGSVDDALGLEIGASLTFGSPESDMRVEGNDGEVLVIYDNNPFDEPALATMSVFDNGAPEAEFSAWTSAMLFEDDLTLPMGLDGAFASLGGLGGQSFDVIGLEAEFFYDDEGGDNFTHAYYLQVFALFDTTTFSIENGELSDFSLPAFDDAETTLMVISDVPLDQDGIPDPDAARGIASGVPSIGSIVVDVAPVPLPAGAFLGLTGLAVLGGMSRRKKG